MKEAMAYPGMLKPSPLRPNRRVFYIDDANTARFEEMEREVTTLGAVYPCLAGEEPYAMPLEPLRRFRESVFAVVRERMGVSPTRHGRAH